MHREADLRSARFPFFREETGEATKDIPQETVQATVVLAQQFGAIKVSPQESVPEHDVSVSFLRLQEEGIVKVVEVVSQAPVQNCTERQTVELHVLQLDERHERSVYLEVTCRSRPRRASAADDGSHCGAKAAWASEAQSPTCRGAKSHLPCAKSRGIFCPRARRFHDVAEAQKAKRRG